MTEQLVEMLELEQLVNLYRETRLNTIQITNPLSTEDFVVQPVADVSPPKWHLGHTSWFFETFILKPYFEGYEEFHPSFNYLFNSYYESVGEMWQRTSRGNLSRPTVEQVKEYREFVDEHIFRFLNNNHKDKDHEEIKKRLEIGIHHEKQHQELLMTDIKYILGHNPLFPPYSSSKTKINTSGTEAEWLEIEEGLYEIGAEEKHFSYDNEREKHRVYLRNYEIMSHPVTNEEYLEFIEDSGYERFEFWLSDGWDWVKANEIDKPMYWFRKNKRWQYYTLRGLKDLEPAAPVAHISYYEADAFARWKGVRLPTETEWEVAATKYQQKLNDKANLLGKKLFQPIPATKDNYQFFGDIWEWTASAYLPYPGFVADEGALGEYNGKFMVNQMVLRGGSCATPMNHIRHSYRNFFQPDKQWQFSGIRLARNIK